MAGAHRASLSGSTHLPTILSTLEPRLRDGEFVFVSVTPDQAGSLDGLATIAEMEGTSMVLRRGDADAAYLSYDFVARWITLTVHSSLATVGLTATITAALANEGIGCNVLAGFHHDHLLVVADQADRSMDVLRELARTGGSSLR